ncbi:transferase family hexapeptide repeat protein [Cellulophaga sp. RHA_52]|uniref:acyltransferase n=1 Tax=Cellulophaga sp. RHA_52 TaxID=1250036 RepID=UPI00119AF450|nr:acyltransferase [Cellulophaga sp. RHA_52]TVZ08250.1 transferase family hexapeptide repeat protein [Cellulophaga sp. RHA_52]
METIKKIVAYIFYPKINVEKNPISVGSIIRMGITQRIFGINRKIPWPVHFTSSVSFSNNIIREDGASYPGYMPGGYIQAKSKIYIGKNTRIGPGVKIISENHDIYDIDNHIKSSPIKIGRNCWIGANVVILPEVEVADYTVIAAGAVVTKSFKEGNCILGGVPAKVIKELKNN